MSWLGATIYDRFTRRSEQACLQNWRASLLAGVRGDVLEVGAGTGANLAHYPPAVERLVLVEPDRYMRMKLSNKLATSGRTNSVDIIDRALEKLDLPDESFDFVVATLVLCSNRVSLDQPQSLCYFSICEFVLSRDQHAHLLFFYCGRIVVVLCVAQSVLDDLRQQKTDSENGRQPNHPSWECGN